MTRLIALVAFLPIAAFANPEAEAPEKKDEKQKQPAAGHVFAWPFMEWESMKPRGGTTRGSEVTLVTEPKASWLAARESGLSTIERDRRAILALAGSYRVSFDFVETLGFGADYSPPRPYFSWGTEHVHVLADSPEFISLQHTLVMYFKGKDGEVSGPHIMKHWRQDWTYEDTSIFTYRGDNTWATGPASAPSGRWSQAVYQVDDSPRYQVMGAWTHEGGVSTWSSDDSWRPLPRREFSVRDDYNILAGRHTITVGPTGWTHLQNNRKLRIDAEGEVVETVGTELGISRYEEISEPDLATGFKGEWEKTAPYWAAVRSEWQGLMKLHDSITLKTSYEDQKLWQAHFGDAAALAGGMAEFVPAEQARATLMKFIGDDE